MCCTKREPCLNISFVRLGLEEENVRGRLEMFANVIFFFKKKSAPDPFLGVSCPLTNL